MTNDLEKQFFNPGDIVTIKHDIPNRPVMLVREKVTRSLMNKSGEKENVFIGIKVCWFDLNQVMHEAIFSTKDLEHCK